jgi:8-oxo-dGTP diphosphatase
MTEFVQRVAMKAVLINKGKVLLVREAGTYKEGTNKGRWQIPGGRIEPGEHWMDALKREVREETGITEFTWVKPIYVAEWFPTIKGIPTHIVAMFHFCTTDTEVVSLSDEHDAFEWVDLKKWRDFDVMDPEDKVLAATLKELQVE